MNIEDRIARRRRSGSRRRLVLEEYPLSPVWHPPEPTGRDQLVERLLDHLDPVFDGRMPDDCYLWGPSGSGKSAVTTALVTQLAKTLGSSEEPLYTSTRGGSARSVSFARVDLRRADSPFDFVHAVLDDLTRESVPRRGVGRDALVERLERRVRGEGPVVVVADHVGEPETVDVGTVDERLDDVVGRFAWLAVGRDDPADLALPEGTATLSTAPYTKATLTDVLAARADEALSQGAIEHRHLRRLAEWAEGDAGVALSGLLGAVESATARGKTVVEGDDVEAGMEAVPWPCVPLGRVLALPENKVRVLGRLVEMGPDERAPVADCAAAIAADVDLTASTVERFLYELAESGVVERVRHEAPDGPGRPPSRVEPRFPTLAFRRLVRRRDEMAVA